MLGGEEVLWVHTYINAFCSAMQTVLKDARVHTNAGTYSNMCSKHKHTYFFVFSVTGTDAKEYLDAPSLACALQHHC